jgi:hypothetical protein
VRIIQVLLDPTGTAERGGQSREALGEVVEATKGEGGHRSCPGCQTALPASAFPGQSGVCGECLMGMGD